MSRFHNQRAVVVPHTGLC